MVTTHAVGGPGHRVGAGVLDQLHAAVGEGLLEHGRRVGVLVRQDLVAAGHHGDGYAEFGVGVAELGSGDAGPDDDEVSRQFRQVVELAPVQDPLAVGLGIRQHSRAGPGGDQHDVGLERADPAAGGGDLHAVVGHAGGVVDQLAATVHHGDALTQQLVADVGGLRLRQRLDAVVDLVQRDLGVLDRDVEPETGGASQFGAHAGRCDERLGRDTVPQHACAPDAVGVDHGDLGNLGPASGGHQSGLVAGGTAADDHDARCHGLNASQAGG